ncbi:outer membrane beta-barrel family protein [Mucilaginibacter puniceus]
MKSTFIKIFFTLILIICVNAIFAQTKPATAQVSGSIVDTKNQPVDYATVSLVKATKDSTVVKGTLSSATGTYKISQVAPGTYVIKATSTGFAKTTSQPFTVTGNDVTVPALSMPAVTQTLNAVNIAGTRPLIEQKIDRTVMNVEGSVLAAGNSALEILERAPGVTVDKDDNISLQGKQGVTVMINDKLTYLSAAQLANLLRSTDGNTIKSIEIITNPSAKYDAAGNSGIINIQLKKNNQSGTNGSINLTGSYGYYPKNNTSLSLNHKQGKLNVFGNFSRGDNQRSRTMEIKRTVVDGTNTTYFDQSTFMPGINHFNNYRVGADYDLSSKHTIGFIVNGYFNSSNEFNDNNTRIGTTPAASDSYQNTQSAIHSKYNNFAFNINDKLQLDTNGQALSIDLDHSKFNNNSDARYYTTFFGGSAQQLLLTNQSPSNITIYTAKADYTYPITKTFKFEAGVKYSDVKTDNMLNAQRDNANDPLRTNQFVYTEKIAAGYLNLSKTYKKTAVQLGLRAENTNSNGNSITTGQVVPRGYLNFFPSVFINHSLAAKHNIGLSYSRRIDRPGYDNLNPFVYYLDQYTYSQGNPFLKPQYTNNYELKYTYNKTINLSLGYSKTTDVNTQILLTDPATKVTYQTNLNLQTQNNYTTTFNTPYTITKWFTGNINATGFYTQFKSDNLLGANLNSGRFGYYVKTTQNINFAGFKAELSEFYQSKVIYGLFLVKPQYAVDAGISRAFANKKLNVKLSVSDIFNIRRNDVNSVYQTNDIQIRQKNETRIARLTLTYNFGNSSIKSRNRQTGSSEEASRVSSGN